MAYSLAFDQQVVEAVAILGRSMLTNSDGPPWKEHDTVDLSPVRLRDVRFVLAPAPERTAFRKFRDEKFAVALGLDRRSREHVTFLQVFPVTQDEMAFATEHGSRALLDKVNIKKRGKTFGWGRGSAESVVAPSK